MKWSRAIHHLDELAHTCADMTKRPVTVCTGPMPRGFRRAPSWQCGDRREHPCGTTTFEDHF
jgi:hypothetical protein